MTHISVQTHRPYLVHLSDGCVINPVPLSQILSPHITKGRRVFVLTDANVGPLYLPAFEQALARLGVQAHPYVMTPGESSKNPTQLIAVLEALSQAGFTRRDLLVALGGGVVGDLGGLAASLYCRGIDYVMIPTTLLAMVDSSIGGKTAVNLSTGKNLMGSFYQPRAVIVDPEVLQTLNDVERQSGWGEVLKYGFLVPSILESIERVLARFGADRRIALPTTDIIYACIDCKRRIVEHDEKESGERKLLNLGHTLGHAIEYLLNYTLPHGHAVMLGLGLLMKGLVRMERLSPCRYDLLLEFLEVLHMPTNLREVPKGDTLTAQAICEVVRRDKKGTGDTIDLVIPLQTGECTVETWTWTELDTLIALALGEGGSTATCLNATPTCS